MGLAFCRQFKVSYIESQHRSPLYGVAEGAAA